MLTIKFPRWRAAIATLLTITLCGCSGTSNQTDIHHVVKGAPLSPQQCAAGATIDEAAAGGEPSGAYLIQPGDQLAIDFYLNPEFNDEVTVRPDGNVTLRVVGDVKAWGLTPVQLAQQLDKLYISELRSPDASVHIKNMPSRAVYVEGQVSKPGSFPLEPGMTAVQAISDAGGLTDEAAGDAILIRHDLCGQPSGIRVDLASATNNPDTGADLELMPRDVIVVPRSRIANMDLFVKQYFTGLMPVPPYLSLGPAL